ncbi:MAG: NAD(P)H-hydrate dehydratase [Pararhodobacter sp.]|nr:NAD(P)H-hydrate dehydratase [Pararhodobacter sp.]
MRGIERAAIESGEMSGLALMERAGEGVVEAIIRRWPEVAGQSEGQGARRAVVLCGPGNNGGDGYVVARLLAGRGWQVALWALAPPVSPDAIANAGRWASLGAVQAELDPALLAGGVVVDAMFGTGLVRDVAPPVWGALAMAQEAGARLVAVDILSGLCADSGRVRAEGGYLNRGADLTVTFQAPKLGHALLPGGAMSGALEVVDIGLGARLSALCHGPDEAAIATAVAPPGGARAMAGGHKCEPAHAVVLSGGGGRGGAAWRAARAALRVGAGLATLCCPPSALIENAARLDAVMLRPVADDQALMRLLSDERISALCLGPGLGLGAREAALVGAALRRKRPTVLDADALSLIAQNEALRKLVHAGCVLTPHAGEFARLWPDLAGAESKLEATVRAAAGIGAVVLHKGADTVIAAPDGWPQVHAALRERAAPWLATAGAGDILAGLIAGLMARGWPPDRAAADAAWLHVEAARRFGPGLIAEDLPETLPGVLQDLAAEG